MSSRNNRLSRHVHHSNHSYVLVNRRNGVGLNRLTELHPRIAPYPGRISVWHQPDLAVINLAWTHVRGWDRLHRLRCQHPLPGQLPARVLGVFASTLPWLLAIGLFVSGKFTFLGV